MKKGGWINSPGRWINIGSKVDEKIQKGRSKGKHFCRFLELEIKTKNKNKCLVP